MATESKNQNADKEKESPEKTFRRTEEKPEATGDAGETNQQRPNS